MQIPLLSGIYTNEQADMRQALPINLEPVLRDSGISQGYLRTAPGIVQIGSSPGADRGGYVWNGEHYRVIGRNLVRVARNGSVTILASIGGEGPVAFTNGFDRLAIASGGNLYYWLGGSLIQVTDPNLGRVLDLVWTDGYYMTTDGEYLVVTELNDPTTIDPLKYGSSEIDPDPITGLIRIRGEVYALNRYTIENFRNVGGSGFPFERNPGAMIPKGCVGPRAKCEFDERFAFIGSGRNESISVYIADAGTATSIGTTEVDGYLSKLTDKELAALEMETRLDRDEGRIYIHLPDKTLVYYHKSSIANQEPIWTVHNSGILQDKPYPLKHMVYVGGEWIGGSPDGLIGKLSYDVEDHFSVPVTWEFQTGLVFNDAKGAIFRSCELIGTPGRVPFGLQPRVFFSYSLDGETWSNERALDAGARGNRRRRLQWRPMFKMENYASLRFRGAGTAIQSWARLEADLEGLAV